MTSQSRPALRRAAALAAALALAVWLAGAARGQKGMSAHDDRAPRRARAKTPPARERVGDLPELVVQEGHTQPVAVVKYSRDGKLLASGGGEGSVRVWDVASGRLLRSFGGFTSDIEYLDFSPDGQTLVAGERRVQTYGVWNLRNGKQVVEQHGEPGTFSPDGRWLAASADLEEGEFTEVYDVARGVMLRKVRGTFGSFSADGSLLLTEGLEKGEVFAHSLQQPAPPRVFAGNLAHFEPTAKRLFTQGNASVDLWDAASGRRLNTFRGHFMTLSADGHILVTAVPAPGNDGYLLYLWDVASGKAVGKPPQPLPYLSANTFSNDRVSFNSDAGILAFADAEAGKQDEGTYLWDTKGAKLIRHFEGERFVRFGAEGKTVLLQSSRLIARDIRTGEAVRTIEAKPLGNYDKPYFFKLGSRDLFLCVETQKKDGLPATSLLTLRDAQTATLIWSTPRTDDLYDLADSLSPDKKVFAMGEGNSIKLLATATGELLHLLRGRSESDIAVTPSPDGATLALSSSQRVFLLNAQSGFPRALARPDLPERRGTNTLGNVTFSPDGRDVAASYFDQSSDSSDDAYTIVWDAEGGGVKQVIKGEVLSAFTHWAVGKIITISYKKVGEGPGAATVYNTYLRDVETGALAYSLEGEEPAAFEPDSTKLFATRAETVEGEHVTCRVNLREVESGRVIHTFEGACEAAFSGDGRRFVAESPTPRSYELWDVPNRKFLRLLREPPRRAPTRESRAWESHYMLFFSPDARVVVSARRDGLRWWDASSGTLLHSLGIDVSVFEGIEFSPDGETLAATHAYSNRFSDVFAWSIRSGRSILQGMPRDDFFSTFAFSPDGWLIAQGWTTAQIWDGRTGRLLRTFDPPDEGFASIDFISDDRAVTVNRDGSIGIWSSDLRRLLANITLLEGSDWLVVTPEGLFDGSPDAYNRLVWRFANNSFDFAPVESFFNEFYYPGLLAGVLSGKLPKAPRSISQLDRRLPVLTLTQLDPPPAQGKPVAVPQVKVRVELTEAPRDNTHATGGGARDVRLFRNGLLVKAWHGDVLGGREDDGCRAVGAGRAVCEATVDVVAGENRLVAYAFNRDNIKSEDAALRVAGDKSLEQPGTAYVIAVGVNVYENPNYNLTYAVQDAQDFGDALKAQIGGNLRAGSPRYDRTVVVTLSDAQATRENIMLALRRLAGDSSPLPTGSPLAEIKPARPEDAVFIFFAGHGKAVAQADDGANRPDRFYLIPHDMGYHGERVAWRGEVLKTIEAHAISDHDLEQAFEPIGAGQLVLVIDACNSGEALESEEWRRGPMNSRGLAQLAYEKGMYVLTASQGYESAKESARLGHGFLTYALVEDGLRGGHADREPKDGEILLREWLDYAVWRVPQMQAEKEAQCRGSRADVECTSEDRDKLVRQLAAQKTGQRPRVFYRRESALLQALGFKAGQ